MIIKKIAFAVLLGLSSTVVNATEQFKVDDIQVKGLQRVALGAVLTYIPFNVDDELDDFKISQSLKSLYKSGYFNDISVSRDGNRLIYHVRERETISEIKFDGNKDIKKEQLTDSLDSSNIRVGEPLDKTVLSGIEHALEDFYYSVGKYNAHVKAEVTHLPRNRVKLKFVFKEGDAAAIQQINVVGNKTFTDKEILDHIELKYDSPWWNFMAKDRYQKQTLKGDLEKIKSFYLDKGYLQFKIDSTQVQMTPDKKHVYITLNVTEGTKFKISDVDFIGDMANFEKIIRAINPLKAGELYNGAEVTYTEDLISKFLGRYGYAYPKVKTIPKINEKDKTVKLTISVDPGKRVYVQRINFKGNEVTSEKVLRREMRQMEGAWLSNNLLEVSKARLSRLPYLDKVEFETKQLPGQDDLVNVDFSVKEQPSGSFTAGIGYGSTTKLSLNAGIQQNNFLGTGNRLAFNINTVSYQRSMSLSYTDPYFTVDGISLGGQLFYSEFNASSANLVAYNQKSYGASVNLGFPINEYVRINFGGGYKNNGISKLQTYSQIQKFYDIFSDPANPDGGLNFKTFDVSAAIIRSTLNRGTFPTAGSEQVFSAKITTPNSDVKYFKLNLDAKWYFPITRNQKWSVLTRFQAGYGNGYGTKNGNDQILPFWENFRAGGSDTLRGFQINTAGPRAIFRSATAFPSSPDAIGGSSGCCLGPSHDIVAISQRSVGGNAMVLAGVELIVPTPFLDEKYSNSVRSSLFVDAGNVWDTEFRLDAFKNLANDQFAKISDYSNYKTYRASAGLSIQWLSPMGPMIFSFAKTLKRQPGDNTQFFSFNIGKTF